MVILWRKFNQKNIRLSATEFGARVGIVASDGRLSWGEWSGFITAETARSMNHTRSVRLLINRIGEDEIQDLKPGEYIQGCQLGKAVWAVVDVNVRIIKGPVELKRWPD